MTDSLALIVVLLAAAVIVVVVCRSLGIPPLVGYLVVGVILGPHALGLAKQSEEASYLAEFGVVFLMFTIGLEFSLPKLFQMRRTVAGLGGLQVLVTSVLFIAGFLLAGTDWRAAIAIGAVLCLSSTAIAIRLLAERRELDTPHGREAFGVLLFQDIAVVPLLILIPALAGPQEEIARALGWALAKAAVVLTIILAVGQRLMRGWFHVVARRKSTELFILNVLLITLGLAYITEEAGLSLALGAFLAGMLISETEYRHQVEEDIKPFREVLLGLFFVTVGMGLDLRLVANEAALVLALFLGQLILKGVVVGFLSRAMGSSPGTAIRTALSLAQAGEFGLVLAALAMKAAVVPAPLMQPVIASMLLTMLFGPILIHNSSRIVLRVARSEWMMQSLALHQLAVQSLAADRHVLLLGYGRTGQAIARFLERSRIPFLALDLDPERVREAAAAGEPVVFGDAARREMLVAAGIGRAAALVVTYADTDSAFKVLAVVRELRADLPVIVRTPDDAELDRLTAAGATEVVPETFETSLMLASHALLLMGVPVRKVVDQIRSVRDDRYALMRGFFPGATDEPESIEESHEPRLHSVVMTEGAYGVARSLAELALERYEVSVSAVRQGNTRTASPSPELRLKHGDVVVLKGAAENVAAAEMRLLQGVE